MPKPFLFRRPSGFYCRFLVPGDLRAAVGSRYLVRALDTAHAAVAELHAAQLHVAVADFFARLRRGEQLPPPLPFWRGAAPNAPSSPSTMTAPVPVPGGIDLSSLGALLELALSAVPLLSRPAGPVPPTGSSGAKGLLLSDHADAYLHERKVAGIGLKNLAETRFALGLLGQVVGNKPVADITPEDANEFVQVLLKWPTNASKIRDLAGLSLDETIRLSQERGLPTLQARTIDKYLDRVRTCFQQAAARGKLVRENPFARCRVMRKKVRQKKTRKPFDRQDLARIFDPALRRRTCGKAPHKFWTAPILLYSGMRVGEMAQLFLRDICLHQGIWVFRITEHAGEQRLKNDESHRLVPIHPHLLELGLLDYADDVRRLGFDRLFPHLPYSETNGYGDSVSDWFNGRFLRPAPGSSRLPRAGIADPRKTLHSFRHLVAETLHAIAGKTTLVAEITGHERGSSVLESVYLSEGEVQERFRTISRMSFDVPPVAPYRKGQFDGFFKRFRQR